MILLNIIIIVRLESKISAQPRTTLCIQFLDRENNDKNNTLPLGKQICFRAVCGCAEILPVYFKCRGLANMFQHT